MSYHAVCFQGGGGMIMLSRVPTGAVPHRNLHFHPATDLPCINILVIRNGIHCAVHDYKGV